MIVMKYNNMCTDLLHLRCTTDDKHSYRRMRRACHEALNKKSVTEFYPLHAKEAVKLIDDILQNPEKWNIEFLRWV